MILSLINRAVRWNRRRRRTTILAFFAVILAVLPVIACGSSQPAQTTDKNALLVVTTTALLADLVRNVGGDLVEVTPLVPPGTEVHSFQSTPADSVAISRAALVVSNGGELDEFLDPLIQGSIADSAVWAVAAAQLLDQDETDPHFWQNPLFTVKYVAEIRDGLTAADPENTAAYEENFNSYKDELTKLDFDIASTLDTVDPALRHLITFHDAFGHFARRYDWEITAFSASDGSEVSPGAVVEILEKVRDQGIPAVFAEPQFRADVLENTAQEAGVEVGLIYSDVLDGEVTSYIDMMLFNAKSLARYLR
ncbi:MAG: zinc ABC transporter substrate-binding protein [SAR202 cluster bacterium]|nr:zinc ABC transporter substrate-binding protein [SAR202 cluster bacterium]